MAESNNKVSSSQTFLDTIGVNTHTMYNDTAYPEGGAAKIAGELQYVGISQVRDGLGGSQGLPEYQSLASYGIKFDFFIAAGPGVDSLQTQVSNIARLAPNVLSVEGPNETDLTPLSFGTETGFAATKALQAALYAEVKKTPELANVPVIESSFGNSTTFAKIGEIGNADFANTHSYFFDFASKISNQIPRFINEGQIVAPNKPTITTESGWMSSKSPVQPEISLSAQAKLTLDMLLDQYQAGISKTYLYQLVDQSDQKSQLYGLYYEDGSPKPVAVALHNMSSILAGGQAGITEFQSTLSYQVDGMPSTASSQLFEKKSGVYDLALWDQPPIVDGTTYKDISTKSVPIHVSFDQQFADVSIYDPLIGTSSLQTFNNVASVDITLPDHPIVIEASTPVCFVTGTRIRTTRGSCAVENLAVGDVAVTASGETRPIVWIGHREANCAGHPGLYPVRVATHAFGDNLPERDLWLSPGHPVLVGADADSEGGWLVPIMCLVNGTTIKRMKVETVTYWHIELDQHDILLAEELPAESYLDWGDRDFFAEGSDYRVSHPDYVVPGLGARCRPVALDGPVVEAARRKLAAAFVTRLAGACAWPAVELSAAYY